jgi:hypothetical protein
MSQMPQSQPYRPLLNIYDLIDRVLDKGLVIDANVSVALVGIEILVIRARVVVAGIDTFLRYATALGLAAPIEVRNGAMAEMPASG